MVGIKTWDAHIRFIVWLSRVYTCVKLNNKNHCIRVQLSRACRRRQLVNRCTRSRDRKGMKRLCWWSRGGQRYLSDNEQNPKFLRQRVALPSSICSIVQQSHRVRNTRIFETRSLRHLQGLKFKRRLKPCCQSRCCFEQWDSGRCSSSVCLA